MKKKNLKFVVQLLLLSVFIITGCKNSDGLISNPSQKPKSLLKASEMGFFQENGMLFFDSFDKFSETLEFVLSLDKERENFLLSLGFIPFGYMADNIYFDIDFDKIENINEVYKLSNNNPYIFTIEQDETEEFVVLPGEYDMPERWLMNEDRMYVIDKTIYKHFEEGHVVAAEYNSKNCMLLKQAKLGEWGEFKNKDDFAVYDYYDDELEYSDSDLRGNVHIDGEYTYQPPKPSKYKTVKVEAKNKDKNRRTRVIIKSRRKTKRSFFSSKPTIYNLDVDVTLVNERKGKILWVITKWYNTEYYTRFKANISTQACVQNYNNPFYKVISFKPGYIISESRDIKKDNWSNTIIKQVDNPHIPGKKPWMVITGWEIFVETSSGVILQDIYNY